MQIKSIIIEDIAKYEMLLSHSLMAPENEQVVLDILRALRLSLRQTRNIAQLEWAKTMSDMAKTKRETNNGN